VPSHDAGDWAGALASAALRPDRHAELSANAVVHAKRFSWRRTTDALLQTYAQAAGSFRSTFEPQAEVAV
jgi:D-inositol-3-phosphate glycosyltransferase